ncbi:hypothetical protein [Endozoicomonas montiporae]|uniref:Uncharacterized protein n=1 Tax=Endozoicomonas montiporae CL-33 TaxID=570277 RepID=A0A142B9U1_9GAMM|nr:hypothetical protein [Endozoicomonas montiporae]AMO55517.1 hypothetical protein EZMO1_1327 [Endozoicomonas montiporae CL-33]
MKQILIVLGLWSVFPLQALEIKVNPGKYSVYYHFEYELRPDHYEINKKYGFNDGGQFEVFVPKKYFPIPAPNCNKNIIIRMPYSNKEDTKRALYEKLLQNKAVTVTLEANPYVDVLQEKPLKLQLQYCNVFFRQRDGDYYNQL